MASSIEVECLEAATAHGKDALADFRISEALGLSPFMGCSAYHPFLLRISLPSVFLKSNRSAWSSNPSWNSTRPLVARPCHFGRHSL